MSSDERPDVSRETPPSSAAGVFSSRLPVAEQYADLLATEGVVRGLIGPREVPRLWDRHILNSAVVLPRVPQGASCRRCRHRCRVCRGWSGRLLGLTCKVTLIEPLLRRTTFLDEAVHALGLDNVTVLRARAEDVKQTYDVVTARAVAPLDKLGRWCLPLVRKGGVLLALKGRTAEQEVTASTATLHRLGATTIVVSTYGDDDNPTTVVEVTK